MPAYGELGGQPKRRHAVCRSVLLLVWFLVIGSKALAGTLVNSDPAIEVGVVTSISKSDDDASVDHANVAVVPELMPRAAVGDGGITWTASRISKEVGKQAIDQPGHFLIGAAPIWASRYLVGVPWVGWVAAPILAYREWLQWPSKRWWDPPLDWAFLTLGALAATWSRRRVPGPAGGFAALRQRVVWTLAVRGRMRHAG